MSLPWSRDASPKQTAAISVHSDRRESKAVVRIFCGMLWRGYLINGPNKTVLSTNVESFSANGFSTGFIAREAFYTI